MTRELFIHISLIVSFCSYAQIDSTADRPSAGQWIYTSEIESDSASMKNPYSGYFIDYRDDSTKICEGNYLKNKKNGEWKFYFKDGKTLSRIINFKNNKPLGVYKEYYENGILKDSSFLDGEFHKYIGDRVRYHDNGQVRYSAYYNDNHKEDGKVFYYYRNGQVEFHYEAVNGIPVGEVKIYYENGELKETIISNEKGEEINRIKEP